MEKDDLITLAGSIGGNTGSGGGTIPGGTGDSDKSIPGGTGGESQGSSDCIIVNSLNAKEHYVYIQGLRKWRDDVLTQSIVGRVTIKAYYFISPKLVKIAKKLPIIKKPVKASAILVAKFV